MYIKELYSEVIPLIDKQYCWIELCIGKYENFKWNGHFSK